MGLLIDGYNLLHVSGIIPRGIGPGTLQRSRRALLNFLANSLSESDARATVIVFDAKDAPPGLPNCFQHAGITVHFARDYSDADELIEKLISLDHSPRSLTVVSSDHRIQRAARRRRSSAVDSDRWFKGLLRQRHLSRQPTAPTQAKPDAPLSSEEVQWWLAEFDADSVEIEMIDSPDARQPAAEATEDAETPLTEDPDPVDPKPRDFFNPFPPGYGEDLLDE